MPYIPRHFRPIFDHISYIHFPTFINIFITFDNIPAPPLTINPTLNNIVRTYISHFIPFSANIWSHFGLQDTTFRNITMHLFTSWYIILHFGHRITLLYITLHHKHYITKYFIRDITSHHIEWRHIIFHYITSHHITTY
jgi:hypothetical protein